MKFFVNSEIKKSIALYIIICLLLLFLRWEFFLIGVLFTLLHFIITYARYKKISNLSFDINKILNGNTQINLDKYSEGELSILYTEIHKMTSKLMLQSEALQEDKIFLENSIADISHQLRTPLTSVNLIVSILSKPEIESTKREELYKDLQELLSRIDWLINTLLKLSKLDANTVKFDTKPIDLRQLIQQAIDVFSITTELKQQRITLDLQDGASFSGDFQWTYEAISNIIKNCTEHTPPSGVIHISTSENPLYSEIIISDNGNGIAKEDSPHIFERFYKGKNSSDQSIGIGLALSRVIILKENGTVKVSNKVDGGAQFEIRFYKSII